MVGSASVITIYHSRNQQMLSERARSGMTRLSVLFSDRDIPDSQENFKIFTLAVLEDRTADEEEVKVAEACQALPQDLVFFRNVHILFWYNWKVNWCVWIVFGHHTQFKNLSTWPVISVNNVTRTGPEMMKLVNKPQRHSVPEASLSQTNSGSLLWSWGMVGGLSLTTPCLTLLPGFIFLAALRILCNDSFICLFIVCLLHYPLSSMREGSVSITAVCH